MKAAAVVSQGRNTVMIHDPRTSVITDRHVRDENELPDVPTGAEYARVIAPQKFVVLHQIVVRGPSLIRLQIGEVPDVPFELVSTDSDGRRYRPKDLDKQFFETCHGCLKVGAAAVGPNAIAIAPGLEVWLVLRNDGETPVKPRAALIGQEEAS
jgi:hypothetical protein